MRPIATPPTAMDGVIKEASFHESQSEDEEGPGDTITLSDDDEQSKYYGNDEQDVEEDVSVGLRALPYDDAFALPLYGTRPTPYCENEQMAESSRKHARSASPPNGEPVKRVRFAGTYKDTATVRAERKQDSDERIWDLKHQGLTDQQVVDALCNEGFLRVGHKTIAIRFGKMRQKNDQEEMNRLDDELSDWHVEEDDYLRESCNAVEKKFEQELLKLQQKKWKDIAAHLADRLREKKYTANACQERFEGLLDGTALIPIELDPDQESRAVMRENRIADAKHRRAEAAEAARRAEEAQRNKAEEHNARKTRKRLARLEEKRAKEAAEAEDQRIKAERLQGKAEAKAKKEAALQRAREEAAEKKKIILAENRLYHHFTGRYLKRLQGNKRKADYNDDEDESDAQFTDSDLEEDYESDAGVEIHRTTTGRTIKEKAPRVTKDTLLNPRSVMNDHELQVLLSERGLRPRGENESHAQVVARLAAADWKLDNATLNGLLKEHFVGVKGNLGVRIRRLQECDGDYKSALGQAGTKSTALDFKKGYEGYKGKYEDLIDDD